MMNILKNIFKIEEVNTSRQVEFDFAKTVCIVFMVIIHSFEQLAAPSVVKNGPIHYVVVIVIDVLFVAGTFMASMGMGIIYGKEKNHDEIIHRGFKLFLAGYVLNMYRSLLPYIISILLGNKVFRMVDCIVYVLSDDILQFAGLALILFGWLKKHKCSDLVILFIALSMSIIGSIVRFIDLSNPIISQIVGLFIGTTNTYLYELHIEASAFPLLNWFIIVVIGYLYAKLLRRVNGIEKYYAMALPISGIPLIIYMIIAIPNRIDMMSGDLNYYYFISTPNILILFIAMVFATSIYHYIWKLLSEKIKSTIICISNNLTPIYFYQWIIVIGFYVIIIDICKFEFSNEIVIVMLGIVFCIVSMFIGIRYPNWVKKLTN